MPEHEIKSFYLYIYLGFPRVMQSSHLTLGATVFITAGITIKSNDNMHILYEVKLTDQTTMLCVLFIATVKMNLCIYETCKPH